MPLIKYIEKKIGAARRAVIDQANEIIAEYVAAGFRLTVRQLYYQFVARGLLPNTERQYKRLGEIIGDGRDAGLIDWDAIEDRTRNVRDNAHWDTPADILRACASQFRFDLWAGQPYRPEVWIEKNALTGVFEPVCIELDVPLFACVGYASRSETWSAGYYRIRESIDGEQTPIIFHFGDHDPSGVDMTRDLIARLAMYSGAPVQVDRLALTWDQVEQYSPPPNPAKTTDSRYASYVAAYGDESWELDALEPQMLADLARAAILSVRDDTVWDEAIAEQNRARMRLRRLADEWSDDGEPD